MKPDRGVRNLPAMGDSTAKGGFTVTDRRRFTAGLGETPEPVLWPEHLDVAVAVDAVNYGGSPGDDESGETVHLMSPVWVFARPRP